MSEPAKNRLIGAVVLAAALAPLLVASRLSPAPGGMGTHEQLGLPRCGFHATTGFPCATCGMTTSFAFAVQGNLLRAFLTQPVGAALSIACAAAALIGGWAAVSGMSLAGLGGVLGRPAVVFGGIGLVLAGWGYTIFIHLH